ncbi:type III secretion system chaperone family protein [Spelaeicoccus albus]|uniref:Sensory transduction regulator n=1 Tax=Spelaeicoccus albus TaxID=1280376 RepID=A0A7Z0A7T1_9MICO|nr:YbjN domain-containing protein [Spelaeicoccus albus]NYI66014.1 hypothetical protein [Spelaeicoccus albus]
MADNVSEQPGPINRALRVLEDWADDAGVDAERADANLVAVQLPGEKKLATTVAVKFGEYSVRALAFVVRHPDERTADVHSWLLQRNARLHGAAFMIDSLGDIYLVAELPIAAFDDAACDKLMGHLLATADESFNELLALGFLSSMKREWQWRLSRGESTRNLDAFAHLLSGDE